MVFNIIESFYAEKGVVAAQLESFNLFLNNGIYKIFEDVSDLNVHVSATETFTVKFTQVYINTPSIVVDGFMVKKITPQDARVRDFTYESTVFVDVLEERTVDGKTVSSTLHPHVAAFKVPVMVMSDKCNISALSKEERVQSGECVFDLGGYFIVNGKERVVVGQERINYNHVFVFPDKHDSKSRYVAEIRSMSEETSHSVLIQARMSTERNIVFTIPRVPSAVPAVTLMKALGLASDEIRELVPHLAPFADKCTLSSEQAVAVITAGAVTNSQKMVELFPHMGTAAQRNKALLVAHMCKRLVLVDSGKKIEDDRDNLSLKRVELAGMLLCELLKMHIKKFIESMRKSLIKRADINIVLQKLSGITKGIRHCFATGNWGVQKNAYIRTGVSQVMTRLSYISALSHIRRIVLPIDCEGKNAKFRQIHPTQFGMVCVFETPEGMQIGTVKNMAIFARVSTPQPVQLIIDTLAPLVSGDATKSVVIVNGTLIGYAADPVGFVARVRRMRELSIVGRDLSVVYRDIDDEVVICCDEGRMMRAFFTVSDGVITALNNQTMRWSALVDSGYIVYLDTNEIEDSEIAMEFHNVTRDTKYCEVCPISMLGVCAASIPFADHNQSARNCFQSSMMKQAMSVPVSSYSIRTDNAMNILDYTQRPLVSTVVARAIGMDDMPSGVNTIVAIACYTGFNQEDSVIINQSAIDRGLFVSTAYKTIVYEERRTDSRTYEQVGHHAHKTKNIKLYAKLDERGVIRKGAEVCAGDALISKLTIIINKDRAEVKRDSSIFAQQDNTGHVHDVVYTTNADGYVLIKVVVRKVKVPEIGDKFASRSAQKGTLGMTLRQEDMPFTAEGIVPDIVINPNAIPSRMTIAQLLECVLGKAGTLEGTFNDATPFSENSVDISSRICDRLKAFGYSGDANETMYNGMTGEKFRASIFIGPTYYQRLKHLVSDKIHARADGDVQMLTNQPLEGRSRGGGLRLGEMERDALIAHGSSNFIRERLYTMSDPYELRVCGSCGTTMSKMHECRNCGNDKARTVQIPYATRLLITELEAMSVKVDIRT